jgi:hypothetical protein
MVSFITTQNILSGANAGIAITLAGAGIALGGGSGCTVTAPSSGGACAASLAGSVLTVKLTAGTYNAFTYVSVTVTSFTTPTVGQAAMANVAAGMSDDLSLATPLIGAATSSGRFPTITGAILGLEVTLGSSVKASTTTATISFTPSGAINFDNGNAGIAITLSGYQSGTYINGPCTVTAQSTGSSTECFL